MIPEAPLHRVAQGDYRHMRQPLLIAAETPDQFQEFAWQQGLLTAELRRFEGSPRKFADCPRDKILILLPGWEDHPPTFALVQWWVNDQDRYTVQLDAPLSTTQKTLRNSWLLMLVVCLIIWSYVAYLFLAA